MCDARSWRASAAMGHLDLALWLIRQASPELAAVVQSHMRARTETPAPPYAAHGHSSDHLDLAALQPVDAADDFQFFLVNRCA